MATRVDIGSLRPPTRLADGRLRADAYLTRSGVFSYRNPDGTERREYRPPNEVFNKASMATFAMVPVTDDHPPTMLTAGNARQYAIGSIGESIRQDGDMVAASLVIFDAATIAKMDSGKIQVSCGYECDLADSPGVSPDGERYDAIQTNIRGNHVALVDTARAGASACVRMDTATMIDGKGPDRMDELLKQLAAERAHSAALAVRLDAKAKAKDEDEDEDEDEDKKMPAFLKKKMDEATARADKAEAERDAARAALESADKVRQDAAGGFASAVAARVALETRAGAVLGDAKVADLSDRDIKVAVVKKIDGAEIPADKSEDYVTARFDAAIERVAKSDAALDGVRVATEATRADAGADLESAARARMLKANQARIEGVK